MSRLAAVASSHRYDLVFIQKEMLPHVVDAPEWYMARRGVRYVVDLDDAIHLVYANARGPLRNKLPRVLSRASLVLAGNRWLEAYARRHTARVMYFPTVVDTAKFTPAAGASGNVATEDVVYMLQGLGLETGVDLERLAGIGQWISAVLKRDYGSKAGKALAARKRR